MDYLTSQLVGCIITYNEEVHIERSILSLISLGVPVMVIDSFSTDETVPISERLGAEVLKNTFVNYGEQRSFAISEAKKRGFQWMIFLDADEYLTLELAAEIRQLKVRHEVEGYKMKRRVLWQGTWIRYGGYYPIYFLRLFALNKASLSRGINEHIIVPGNVENLKNDFIDENRHGIDRWIGKHLSYSTFEAEEWINRGLKPMPIQYKILRSFPLLCQPIIYFIYRVVIRGGFRNGINGVWYYMFHSLVIVGLTAFKYSKGVKRS